jgi:hypothetical protein
VIIDASLCTEFSPVTHPRQFPFGRAAEEDAYPGPNQRRYVSRFDAILHGKQDQGSHCRAPVEIPHRQGKRSQTTSDNIRKNDPIRRNRKPIQEFLVGIIIE